MFVAAPGGPTGLPHNKAMAKFSNKKKSTMKNQLPFHVCSNAGKQNKDNQV